MSYVTRVYSFAAVSIFMTFMILVILNTRVVFYSWSLISKGKNTKIQTYNRSNLGRFQNAPGESWTILLAKRYLQK